MILSLLQSIVLTLLAGWNLISGQITTTEKFQNENKDGCDLSVIWNWDAPNQQWNFWAPDIRYDVFYIPEFWQRVIWYMYPEEAYWVYCK